MSLLYIYNISYIPIPLPHPLDGGPHPPLPLPLPGCPGVAPPGGPVRPPLHVCIHKALLTGN